MNTFDKVSSYYSKFNEWSRLDSPSGILEKKAVIEKTMEKLTKGNHILDLGSGPGRYAIEFAKNGYPVTLFDISENLIVEAKHQFELNLLTSMAHGFHVGNAIDLSIFEKEYFEIVFCCGPFYHLVNEHDRRIAALEALRVCKPSGYIFVGFIPRFSGLAGLVNRAASNPEQVSLESFQRAYKDGVFHSADEKGFQEGYYPTVEEFKRFWSSVGLNDIELWSTKTFLHQNEDTVGRIKESDHTLYDAIIEASRQFASSEAFIEAGGHALLIGKKSKESND